MTEETKGKTLFEYRRENDDIRDGYSTLAFLTVPLPPCRPAVSREQKRYMQSFPVLEQVINEILQQPYSSDPHKEKCVQMIRHCVDVFAAHFNFVMFKGVKSICKAMNALTSEALQKIPTKAFRSFFSFFLKRFSF